MDLLKLLTHLRLLVTTVEDAEHAIVDLIHKDYKTGEVDGLKALADLAQFFTAGILTIPGVDPQAILDVLNGLLPAGTPPIVLAKKA